MHIKHLYKAPNIRINSPNWALREYCKSMAAQVATTRLRKELKALMKEPVENIRALPQESNILEWHYVLEGSKGTPYEGGWYHGIVKFPKEYPFKPPGIEMFTPNGRFKTNTKLCLSMSDFHPETWNPLWSVANILMGLYSFMLEEGSTYGSIVTPTSTKEQFAKESLAFNVKNKIFAELFPELVEMHAEHEAKTLALKADSGDGESGASDSAAVQTSSAGITATAAATNSAKTGETDSIQAWIAVLTVFTVVMAGTVAVIMGSQE